VNSAIVADIVTNRCALSASTEILLAAPVLTAALAVAAVVGAGVVTRADTILHAGHPLLLREK
jgi:hypothetical protein